MLPLQDPERSPSRTSSQSQKKLPSIISSLHVASKRTSTSSSVYSVAMTSPNPQHVGMFSIARALGSGHCLSMPPPRPTPCTATVWRNSLARCALRLLLGRLATAQSLPYTNDDHSSTAPTSRSHSRSTSADSVPLSSLSHSHGHAIPPALLVPPFPPPTGPLPPPPLCHQYQFLRQAMPTHPQRTSESLEGQRYLEREKKKSHGALLQAVSNRSPDYGRKRPVPSRQRS